MTKKIFSSFMVFSFFLMVPILCHAFDQWPDTGQTKCYNNSVEIPCPSEGEAFYGQDANYNINPQSYTKLAAGGVELPYTATAGDGWIMTRDNVTGLIWEVKTDDGSIHDKDDTYIWDDTANFITVVNNENFGGLPGWRIPTVKELSTIVNSEIYSPSVDRSFFPNTVSDLYWSSTPVALSWRDGAWPVAFGYGDVLNFLNKFNSLYVRAVRGGQ